MEGQFPPNPGNRQERKAGKGLDTCKEDVLVMGRQSMMVEGRKVGDCKAIGIQHGGEIREIAGLTVTEVLIHTRL